MDNDDNHNDDGDVHDDDYVMTDLKMSALLTLTNKYSYIVIVPAAFVIMIWKDSRPREARPKNLVYIYIYI